MNIDVMSFNLRYWNKADGLTPGPTVQCCGICHSEICPIGYGNTRGLPEMLADLDTDLPDYAHRAWPGF